jgi:hypothetical protein
MRLGERILESDGVVGLDESDAESGRNEVLHSALPLLEDVLAVDNLGNVLGDGRVRACSRKIVSSDARLTPEARVRTYRCRSCPSARRDQLRSGVTAGSSVLLGGQARRGGTVRSLETRAGGSQSICRRCRRRGSCVRG